MKSQGLKVLVVGDDSSDRETTAGILSDPLYGLSYVPPDDESLRRVRTEDVAVILVDVESRTPNGARTAERVRGRQETRTTPIIILTADAEAEARPFRGREYGPVDYVRRPVIPDILRAKVRTFVDLFRHERTADRLTRRLEVLTRAVRGQVEALRQAEREQAHFAAIVESCDDAIVGMSLRGDIVSWNAAAQRLFGFPQEEMLGRPFLRLIPPENVPETEGILNAVRRGRQVAPRETGVVRMDGATLEVFLSLSSIRSLGGAVTGTSAIARDISERRSLERQVIVAGRLAAVGTLAAGVAHEINNPLAYVTSNVNYVASGIEEALREPAAAGRNLPLAQWREILSETQKGAERMRAIVRDLQVVSRRDEASPGPVDVHRVLESSINIVSNTVRQRARLVRDYADVPPVRATETRLGQVFLNLLVNAVQAIPEGRADRNEIRIATRLGEGDRVVVEISDSGCGIPAEHLERIFDPFFTTKPVGDGTGLGLSICHSIIKGLDGSIEVESAPGNGTRFWILLPADHQAAGPAAALPPPPVSDRRLRVLLVDDEPLFRAALRRALSRECDLAFAESGDAALGRLTGGERFDAIVCDLMMADRTGMELYDDLKRLAPAQAERMIFLTGGAFTESARSFIDHVPNPCLEKPVDLGVLRAAIRRVTP